MPGMHLANTSTYTTLIIDNLVISSKFVIMILYSESDAYETISEIQ